jgi:hypothetical protein
VNRWKAILSVVCLAIWLPATRHCQLENLPGLAFLQCSSDTSESSECEDDSCDAVERGMYKAPDGQQVTPPPVPLMLAWMISEIQATQQNEEALLQTPTSSPPDVPKGWQFLTRTASPPRAPSFAS